MDQAAFSPAVTTFLDRPLHAVLATFAPNGTISQSVVWFLRDDATLWISARPTSAKARLIGIDPRVSLCVLAPHGGSYVRVEGKAAIDGHVSDEQRRRLVSLYVGADAPNWLAEHPLPSPNALIRIRPERVVSRGL